MSHQTRGARDHKGTNSDKAALTGSNTIITGTFKNPPAQLHLCAMEQDFRGYSVTAAPSSSAPAVVVSTAASHLPVLLSAFHMWHNWPWPPSPTGAEAAWTKGAVAPGIFLFYPHLLEQGGMILWVTIMPFNRIPSTTSVMWLAFLKVFLRIKTV